MTAARDRDAGFTLAEVLVSMLVMSMLGLAVVGVVSSVSRASVESNHRIAATTRAQNLADRLTKSIRAAHLSTATVPASAFTYADARHITFYSDEGDANGPRLVDVSVPGTGTTSRESLTEVVRVPTAPGVYPATGRTQTVAPGDLDLSAPTDGSTRAPVFAFYDPTGAPLTGPLDASQRASIVRVQLTLSLAEPGPGAASTVTTALYLRNMEYR